MLNNSFRRFDIRQEEHIMERFIPSAASRTTYRAQPWEGSFSPAIQSDESILNLNQTQLNEGSLLNRQRINTTNATTTTNTDISDIANALSFTGHSRVLNFTPTNPNRRRIQISGSSPGSSSAEISAEGQSPSITSSYHSSAVISMRSFDNDSTPSRTSFDSDISIGSVTPLKKKPIKSHIPYRVLDAPYLRNDFYTNLISWSKSTGKLAVGLGSNVYIWSEGEGATLLELSDDDYISCVAFSNADYIIITSKSGTISLFSQTFPGLMDEYINLNAGICCVTWFPDSNEKFFAGDESGEVLYFEIDKPGRLNLITKFKCHQQQICGIAISNDSKQISVGGNDNCCTIWDIDDIKNPKLKFLLPHNAAVKAIAYCPWSKSLLATGGGSKDRKIRFWHTNSGTLLDTIQTKGQITSLLWSRCKKQIVVTFGFGETQKPIFIAVYSYPKMETLVRVEAASNLRVLSAVLSPDSSSVCVASNDETVRFYQLWNPQDSIILESQENGDLGSDLIELCEGITKTGGWIR